MKLSKPEIKLIIRALYLAAVSESELADCYDGKGTIAAKAIQSANKYLKLQAILLKNGGRRE